MKPWMKEGQTTMIYAGYGVGKSILAILIGYITGLENYDDKECEIGEWQVKTLTGCLYVDGEMGELEMNERISQFEWLGKQSQEHRLRVLSIPEYQLKTEDTFSLSKRENQSKLLLWFKEHPCYKLIILDSVTTLFGLEDENNNAEWSNKVNPFLRDLRAMGIHNIILHHSGKDVKKGLRGASGMGAMAQQIFRLIDYDKNIDDGEASFRIRKDKQRSVGYQFKEFALRFFQNENKTETHWKITKPDDDE
jgi:RecA-family ATPase